MRRYVSDGLCESVDTACPRLATRCFTKEGRGIFLLCAAHGSDEGQLLTAFGGYEEVLFW